MPTFTREADRREQSNSHTKLSNTYKALVRMKCISPITLRQKNSITHVPCGKCNPCLSARRADWSFRIYQESQQCNSAYFLTATYNEKHQPMVSIESDLDIPHEEQIKVGTLDKSDLQLFIKQLRNSNERDPSNPEFAKIKYYAVGEYGGTTWRPHYHAIIFNLKPSTLTKLPKLWNKGYITAGTVEPASIHYVTKYVLSSEDKTIYAKAGVLPPFALISQGMGKSYLSTNGFEHKKALQAFVFGNRGRQRLPRYYKDKIFSITDKQSLAENAISENDILYRQTINALEQFAQDPHRQLEILNEQKNQYIEKSKKDTTTKLKPDEYF